MHLEGNPCKKSINLLKILPLENALRVRSNTQLKICKSSRKSENDEILIFSSYPCLIIDE